MSCFYNNCIAICFDHALEANFIAGDANLSPEFPSYFGAGVLFYDGTYIPCPTLTD